MNFADSVKMTDKFKEETKRTDDMKKKVVSGDITYRDFTDIMAHATANMMTDIDSKGDFEPMKVLLIALISAEIVDKAWELFVEEYGKDTEEE